MCWLVSSSPRLSFQFVAGLFFLACLATASRASDQGVFCWIDAKTGDRVTATFPAALSATDYRNQAGGIASSGHASSSITGQNFFSPDGGQTWIEFRYGAIRGDRSWRSKRHRLSQPSGRNQSQ